MTEPSAPPVPPVCYRHTDRETYISCQRCGKPICPDCMNDAAVGFQCPDCIRQGAKSTRSGRTAYGGKRSADPALTSKVLVGMNVAVWLLIVATGGGGSDWVLRLALIPDEVCAVFSPVQGCLQVADGVATGAYWQLVTTMFTHVEIYHIGFNMLALWILGPQLELSLGRVRFLALYLLSGLAGSVTVYWLSAVNGPTLGASGAVFGLLGALLVIALKVGGDARGLLIWIGLNFVITFTVPNISWQGHLGGFVGGAAVAAVLVYAPKQNRTLWQSLGLAAIAVVLLAGTVLRTVQLS